MTWREGTRGAMHSRFAARRVRVAKQRWIIERDYQELKQEIGMGHFEGRGWRGFQHHASLRIAAYGFLVWERCLFPLRSRSTSPTSIFFRYHAGQPDYAPCGAAGAH